MSGLLDPVTTPAPVPVVPSKPGTLTDAEKRAKDPELGAIYNSITPYFPFPDIRPAQEAAMTAWSGAIQHNKFSVIMELPTGSGKSGLAWTIGAHAVDHGSQGYQPGAYILTTQKSLQTQYMRDFGSKGMTELMGAANYRCRDFSTDCQSGSMIRRSMKARGKEEDIPACEYCEYRSAKGVFAASGVGVTNFAYFLSEVKHIGQLKPREVLIIDEAHNTEAQILGQVEIEITRSRCADLGILPPPKINNGDIQRARAWVLDNYLPPAEVYLEHLQSEVLRLPQAEQVAGMRRASNMEQFLGRMKAIQNPEGVRDWFCNVDDTTGALKLRPLTAASFAYDSLFRMGRRVLFLSATILDAGSFARGLGLDPADIGVRKVGSDFPKENRRIRVFPTGSMSRKNQQATLPHMLAMIKNILDRHPNEKGLIHTQSYALTSIIRSALADTVHAERLLVPDAGYDQRKAHLEAHHNSSEPTVLLSPSMTEGLDLYGDLSRFQIIPKVPYPSWGDPFIKARMDHDAGWYDWITCLTLAQATGRSIRSRTDHAVTYILDSDFINLMGRCGNKILPEWWRDAIEYPKLKDL